MRRVFVGFVVFCQAGLWTTGALATTGRGPQFWPPGSDPKSNYPSKSHTEIGSAGTPLPGACRSSPNGSTCVNAAVYYLDKARARLGQPAYKLPANFVKLGPVKETFILTNLDRALYNLPPIPGLTDELDQDALRTGVDKNADPQSTDPNAPSYTANWAGPFDNLPLAYEAWMYDDGYGSFNGDCTSPNAPGCWGHRHDILWEFKSQYYGTGPLAMGAAAQRTKGYAMIIVRGSSSAYKPTYIYTWQQAQRDGAGKHTYKVSKPH